MTRFTSLFILFFAAIHFSISVFGQTNTYIINGSARQINCNCYMLTLDANGQSGSVWNAEKIDLTQSFDFVFNVYLGCKDSDGADGIVFILQPNSTSLGITGEGMGFQGISPSIGIALDTWQNFNLNDPSYDHISIQANGNSNHTNDLSGPVQISATSPNVEDCQWHTLRISWDANSFLLQAYFDGILRVESRVNLVAAIFNNDPLVYWGFSGGTGGANNLQQFCTALNPGFSTSVPGNEACYGDTILFKNESESFAPIRQFHWDLGDGNTDTSEVPPPHFYDSPGIYHVRLVVTGLDGCRSDTLEKTVAIGDYPDAAFDLSDTCSGESPRLIDKSLVSVGNISKWHWNVDGINSFASQNPVISNPSIGSHQVSLAVESSLGCRSDTVVKSFLIKPRPEILATAMDGCIGVPISLAGEQTDNATTITGWQWDLGDGRTVGERDPRVTYDRSGSYDIRLTALAGNGCQSETLEIPVTVYETVANAGNDTLIFLNDLLPLQATGGAVYQWTPATGLSNPNIANPVADIQDDMTYKVTVTSAEGCKDEDEIRITVFKGSNVFVPSAFTPNGDGLNDLLRPGLIGIKTLEQFSVYNRWGQRLFLTHAMNHGWDGRFDGKAQPAGVYVWMLHAVDYVGKSYELRGTVTLIR